MQLLHLFQRAPWPASVPGRGLERSSGWWQGGAALATLTPLPGIGSASGRRQGALGRGVKDALKPAPPWTERTGRMRRVGGVEGRG